MTSRLESIARVCHVAVTEVQRQNGEPVCPPWDEMSDESRAAALRGVEFALGGGTPQEQHADWSRGMLADGWRRGSDKDKAQKTHPALVPYGELPEEQRVKDVLVAVIARGLSGEPDSALGAALSALQLVAARADDGGLPFTRIEIGAIARAGIIEAGGRPGRRAAESEPEREGAL